MDQVKRIKEICYEKNISIAALEKKCNFANGYFGKLRKGQLPIDKLKIVANVLNVPFISFLETEISATEQLSEQEMILIDCFRKEQSNDGMLHKFVELAIKAKLLDSETNALSDKLAKPLEDNNA